MWMRFGATQIHVDPGPGALVRALTHVPPCNPRELEAIVLSHKHLDHSGDVNVMIEAMTSGGFRRRGAILAPADAFDDEPVVLPYARRFVDTRRTSRAEQRSVSHRRGRALHLDAARARGADARASLRPRRDAGRVRALRPLLRRTRRRLRPASSRRADRQRASLPRRDERRSPHVVRRSPRRCRRASEESPSFNTSERRCSKPILGGSRCGSKTSSDCARSPLTTALRWIWRRRSRRRVKPVAAGRRVGAAAVRGASEVACCR